MPNSNATIRKAMCQQRAALALWQRRKAARAFARNIQRSSIFHHAQHIATYIAVRGEADPQYLVRPAWGKGKNIYLPVLSNLHKGYLQFALWHEKTVFVPNRFKILEPVVKPKELISAKQLDLVLMPLTAFDIDGNRLGMGGGYYDRSFSFLRQPSRAYQRKPYLLGIAYAFQQSVKIQSQVWDVPLVAVATERKIQVFR